jgi:NAD(P)H-nitrite reductase large subunit
MTPRKTRKILCECLGVTEDEVVAAIEGEGLRTVRQVTACTTAGAGCTACHPAIREHLARAAKARAQKEAAAEVSPAAALPPASFLRA